MEDKLRIHGIGLTKFLILWILNGLIWWFFRNYLNFVIGIMMLLAAILSWGALFCYRRRFKAGIDFSKPYIEKRNKLAFQVKVSGETIWLPLEVKLGYSIFNVFTGEREEFSKTSYIVPGRGKSISYTIDPEHCGMLEGRLEQFVIYDFLHIFKFYSANKSNGQAISYPRYQRKEYEEIFDLVENFPKEDENKNMGNDYTLDCEVRDYIEGDSLKNIHWKLTAKKDNLMIRERLSTGKHRMNVILPFCDSILVNSELMDSLRWLLEELIAKEYPVQLVWWNSRENRMKSDFIAEHSAIEQTIYEILSVNSLEGQRNIIEQFEVEHKGVPYIVVKAGEKKGAYIC